MLAWTRTRAVEVREGGFRTPAGGRAEQALLGVGRAGRKEKEAR